MSTTTGATEETRILALTDKQLARVMNGLVAAYSPADGEWHDDLAAMAFTTCLDAMRGMRIASAADVATVPTAEEIAAIEMVLEIAKVGVETALRHGYLTDERAKAKPGGAFSIVRAYLERVTV